MMLSAMAGMLAASANDVYGLRSYRLTAQEKIGARIAKKKKCKSCKHFRKNGNGRCGCGIHARVDYRVYPMAVACGEYKKRNK